MILTVNNDYFVGFEVLTAVGTEMAVFWVVAPCSLVEVYQRFRGPCCLHHQGDCSDNTAQQSRRQPSTIISLNSVNQLIFVMVKCCVFFAVRTELLNIVYMSFVLQRVEHSCNSDGTP
jgi:hypothetical protein